MTKSYRTEYFTTDNKQWNISYKGHSMRQAIDSVVCRTAVVEGKPLFPVRVFENDKQIYEYGKPE